MQTAAVHQGIIQDITRQRLLLVLVSLAGFMGALDTTIVNISLPTIATYFSTTITLVSWVAMAYLLTLSATLIAFGRLADIRGYRNVYICGFAIFTAGSLLCGMFAGGIGELVGFRILQAIGAAMLQAIGGAMISMYLPAQNRGRALGIMTTFISFGVAAGPVLGGFLTTYLAWQWIFLINVPVGIASLLLAVWVLPHDGPVSPASQQQFDAAGAGFLFGALGTLVFAINMSRTFGWTSPVILGSAGASVLFFIIFILHERKSPAPLVDLAFFRNRDYSFANAGALIAMLLVTGSSYILPFYLEFGKGLGTAEAGVLLMVPALALMVMGPVAGRISDQIGSRRLCLGAAACYITAYLLYSQMTPSTGYIHIIAALLLMGLSAGLFIPPNFRMILGYSPRGSEGVVSSIAMTVRNIGSVMAVALYGSIFTLIGFAQGIDPETKHLTVSSMNAGFHAVFLFGAGLGVLMLVLTLVMREQGRALVENDEAAGMRGL